MTLSRSVICESNINYLFFDNFIRWGMEDGWEYRKKDEQQHKQRLIKIKERKRDGIKQAKTTEKLLKIRERE